MHENLNWWAALEPQWQQTFREAFFNCPEADFHPTEAQLRALRQTEVLRLAGPGAPHPNMGIVLTNLSGLTALKCLSFLSVTDHAIVSLGELSGHRVLSSLFVHDNRLQSLEGIQGNKHLKELYAQNNQLQNLEPLRGLTHLRKLYVSGNPLTSLSGLTEAHGTEMRDCFVLPNDSLPNRELIRLQLEIGLIPRRG